MTLAYSSASQSAATEQTFTGLVLEGRYALGLPLGAGGMGTVYAGRQLRLDRDVAIKVLDPAFSNNSEAAARFMREAKLLSRIRHPNVIGLFDYGESEEGLMYCVMELLVGSDLEQLHARMPHGCMPWPGACDLLAQIADGLAAVHARGIVHRDVKPSNCFVSFDDNNEPLVKLLDFGVARSVHGDAGPKLTQAGLLIGTPSHIAPELLTTRASATPTSDLYSLGVVAYRLLSGELPFVGETLFAQMNAACTEEPAALDDPDLDIPVELQRIVMGLLEKDPTRRLGDAREVADRLRLVAGHGPAPALPVELPLRHAHVVDLAGDTMAAVPNLDAFDPSPPEPTIPMPVDDSIEELELEAILQPEPIATGWARDRRLWIVAALLVALLVAALLVAFSEDPAATPTSEHASVSQASW